MDFYEGKGFLYQVSSFSIIIHLKKHTQSDTKIG